METMFVKPNTGPDGQLIKIRLPDKPHMFLPNEGDRVPRNSFWLRRLKDGSVVEAKAQAKPKTPKE